MASQANTPENDVTLDPTNRPKWLAWFAVLLCVNIVVLIFLGGQVKSHDAGLAVPDWPMTFGENPITYPVSKWYGGIFHEHFHRLYAGVTAVLSVVMLGLLFLVRVPWWIRTVSALSVVAVIAQAVLGGLTVIYLLPVWASSSHAILAQTYLVLHVIIAYGLSKDYWERRAAGLHGARESRTPLFAAAVVLIAAVYGQLFFGALMRHTEAALAVPDFPTMGGQWIPRLDDEMMTTINDWRLDTSFETGADLPPVTKTQVALHLAHRAGAVVVTLAVLVLLWLAHRFERAKPGVLLPSYLLVGLTIFQFALGIMTVLTQRTPIITSIHVMTGAAVLALAAWAVCRAYTPKPLREESRAGATAGRQAVAS
jgi:cytochrome c oxidase assembly protein subunit 15